MTNGQCLNKLLKIYGIGEFDWMCEVYTTTNLPTYHHIKKKENGGKTSVDNGAILSFNSHQILHYLEYNNINLFNKWQRLFVLINKNKKISKTLYFYMCYLRRLTDIYLLEKNEYIDYAKRIKLK